GLMNGLETVVRIFDTGHVNVVSAEFEQEKEYFPVQYPAANGRDARELIAEIEALPGVRAALPRITAYATLSDSVVKHAQLWGIDINRELEINDFNIADKTDGLVSGRYPEPGANECAVGIYLAEKAGLSIGDRIPLKTVSAQFSDKYWSPVITGFFEFDYRKFDEETILVPFDRLQQLLVMNGGTQQLFIYADKVEESGVIADRVQKLLGTDNVVREWRDSYWVALMQSTSGVYIIMYLVFQIVASFLIINTVLMIIHERIKEIGMMGSLGMTRAEIVAVFFFEAVFLSVIGSLIGCILGGVITGIGSLFPISMDTFTGGGMKDFPTAGTIFLDFSPLTVAEGFIFGVVVSSLCTLIPSLKSAFIEPVEALRR
ncbi:MAG: FtsX-like permease family protein, partial [Spirochaetaceae bacterium]|nr:FtsX-like permease family protein [Spirochaetaceae bacterium]